MASATPSCSASRSARAAASSSRSLSFSARSLPSCGSGRLAPCCSSRSSSFNRSFSTFSRRVSASSSWTRLSAGALGMFGLVDIAAETGLELTQAEMLHLATQKPSFRGQAFDPALAFEGEAIELARVDEKAQLQLVGVVFNDVFEAGHGPLSNLTGRETAHATQYDINRRARHRRNLR